MTTIVEQAMAVARDATREHGQRGAGGYVLVGAAVRALADAGMLCPPPPAPSPRVLPAVLKPRHVEILLLVEQGLTHPEIAAQLVIGWETVRTHATYLRNLLGAHTTRQAATIARNAGLLPEVVPSGQL